MSVTPIPGLLSNPGRAFVATSLALLLAACANHVEIRQINFTSTAASTPTPGPAAHPAPAMAAPTPIAEPELEWPKAASHARSKPAPIRGKPKTLPAAFDHASKAAEALPDNWIAKVTAPPLIRIPGPPQLMRVWIGAPEFEPSSAAGSNSAKTTMPALSRTARVTPLPSGLEITPKQSICLTIHDTGSEVVFSLKASERGTYSVGAQVELYEAADCTGNPIPKTTDIIDVKVDVDIAEETRRAGDEAREDAFAAALKLWKETLGILVAGLVVAFRKRLSRLLGIKLGDDGAEKDEKPK